MSLNEKKDPPSYPDSAGGVPAPQASYGNGYPQQQNMYMAQQQPGMQFQQTAMGSPMMGGQQMLPMQPQMTGHPQMMGMQGVQPQMTGHPQMMTMQPQMTGQPSMMSMNATMGVGGGVQHPQPVQPQATGVQMNVMMPGAAPTPNYLQLCQQGQHARTRRYGACGIITAIVFFPIGIFALFLDVEEYCTRCGTRF